MKILKHAVKGNHILIQPFISVAVMFEIKVKYSSIAKV